MKKKSCFCCPEAFFVLLLIVVVFFASICTSLLQLTFAQIIGTNEDTFSAKGLISSLVTRTNASTTTNTTAINSTKAPTTATTNTTAINSTKALKALATTTAPTAAIPPPYRLTGTWHLNVTNGNVTNFKANFVMSHLNANNLTANNKNLSRTYEITNFLTQRDKYIQLNGDGTAFILGGADVKSTDGIDNWKNVDTVIILDRLNSMKIILDSNATNNHFNSVIFGTADSVKDHNGKEMKTSIGASISTSNMTTSPTPRAGISSPSSPISPPTTSNTPAAPPNVGNLPR